MSTLQKLRRVYLCTHALSWAAQEAALATMDDAQREREFGMGDHWPGRAEACLQRDRKLRWCPLLA